MNVEAPLDSNGSTPNTRLLHLFRVERTGARWSSLVLDATPCAQTLSRCRQKLSSRRFFWPDAKTICGVGPSKVWELVGISRTNSPVVRATLVEDGGGPLHGTPLTQST